MGKATAPSSASTYSSRWIASRSSLAHICHLSSPGAAALARYLGQLLEFQQKHRFIVTNSPRSDMLANQLCQLNGKTRYTGPDILGALGMKDDAGKFMELDPVGISLVERLGLFERPYVTIQRGVDHNKPHRPQREAVAGRQIQRTGEKTQGITSRSANRPNGLLHGTLRSDRRRRSRPSVLSRK